MSTHTSSAPVAIPEHLLTKFDLGIWHTLFNWHNLTIAVQNQWGGPDSSDKRDWLAGQVSELFASDPLTECEDVEVMLLQVLEDEFGVRIEDDSEIDIAKEIVEIHKEILEGNTGTVDTLHNKWESRGRREVVVENASIKEVYQEVEWPSGDEDSGGDDEDVEMGEAPPPPPAVAKVKPAVEVDDEGFTKVTGRKKR